MTPSETTLPSVATYDALYCYATDVLALLDTGGHWRYASPSVRSVFGAAPAALLGAALVERIHLDDRAAVQAALVQVCAQPSVPDSVTFRYQHTDGAWLTIAATLTNCLDDPLLAGLVLVGRDVTAQQEAQAQAQAEAATTRLQVLQAVTDTVLAHVGLDDLMRQVLERVTEVLGVDNTAILLLDEGEQELRLHLARGPEEALAGQVRVPRGQGVAGRIVETQEPLIVEDMEQADPVNPFLRAHIRALLGVPLRVNSRSIGVLHVGTLAPRRFSAQDLYWLQLVADRIALALDHARLYREAQTERGRALDQAQRLSAILEAVADGVFLFGPDGEVLQTNAAARSLFTLEAPPTAYVAPLRERGYQSVVHDEQDRPLPEPEWPFARVLRGEVLTGPSTVALRVRTPSGGMVEVDVSGAPMRDEHGQITGAVCVVRDVTERRRLERRTHDALDALLALARTLVHAPSVGQEADMMESAAPQDVGQSLVALTREVLGCTRVGLVAFDLEQGVQRPLAVAGLSPEQERLWWQSVEGAPVSDPQAPTDADAVARFLAGEVILLDMMRPPFDTLSNPFEIRTALFAPLRVGGDIIGVLSLDYGGDAHGYTPEERALAGAVAHLAALVLERERLLHERAAAQANALALREVNRRMDEFLAIATHELRSPLTGIRGSLQLLQRRLLAAPGSAEAVGEVHDLLQRAIDQTGRLTRMMGDLLDVSRIQSGHLELHPESCDLVALARHCAEEVQLAWPARTIALEAPASQLRVQADADRLEQVVGNYLTNALKYSPPAQLVQVIVEPAAGVARLRVRDQGPGLTEEQQQDIWERYRRVPAVAVQDDAAAGGGLGLGLYISRTIIEQHGGTVGVESAPGTGSTFWFTLPLAQSLHP